MSLNDDQLNEAIKRFLAKMADDEAPDCALCTCSAFLKFIQETAEQDGNPLDTDRLGVLINDLADKMLTEDDWHEGPAAAVKWLLEQRPVLTKWDLAFLGGSAKLWEIVMERVAQSLLKANTIIQTLQTAGEVLKALTEGTPPDEIPEKVPGIEGIVQMPQASKRSDVGPLPDALLKILRGPDAPDPQRGGEPN